MEKHSQAGDISIWFLFQPWRSPRGSGKRRQEARKPSAGALTAAPWCPRPRGGNGRRPDSTQHPGSHKRRGGRALDHLDLVWKLPCSARCSGFHHINPDFGLFPHSPPTRKPPSLSCPRQGRLGTPGWCLEPEGKLFPSPSPTSHSTEEDPETRRCTTCLERPCLGGVELLPNFQK